MLWTSVWVFECGNEEKTLLFWWRHAEQMCFPTGCWSNPPCLLQSEEQQSSILEMTQEQSDKSLCDALRTWVGCRQSCWQSGDGDPNWREAWAWIHAGLWVDAPLAPVTRLAWEHARTGAVRRGWGKRSAILWLAGRMIKLWVIQCLLVRRRSITFRHHLQGAPIKKDKWETAASKLVFSVYYLQWNSSSTNLNCTV